MANRLSNLDMVPMIMNPSRFGVSDNLLDSYDSAAGWTLDNYMTITGGQFVYTSAQHTASNSTKPLTVTLSDTLWYADFDFSQSADNFNDNHGMLLFNIQAGTGDPNTASADRISWVEVMNYSDSRGLLTSKDGATVNNEAAASPDLVNGTRYYHRLQRDSATQCHWQAFTNAGRTSIHTSSTQTDLASTVISLDTLCHATGASATTTTLSGTFNESNIYDGVAS